MIVNYILNKLGSVLGLPAHGGFTRLRWGRRTQQSERVRCVYSLLTASSRRKSFACRFCHEFPSFTYRFYASRPGVEGKRFSFKVSPVTGHKALPFVFSSTYELPFPPARLSAPLFSSTYKLLGGQLPCFHNHLRCRGPGPSGPGGFSGLLFHPSPACPALAGSQVTHFLPLAHCLSPSFRLGPLFPTICRSFAKYQGWHGKEH
jgi:hypothetical protein